MLLGFAELGFVSGVFTVLLPDLNAALDLGPERLGAALSVLFSAGIVGLLIGGRFADRIGRRPLWVFGNSVGGLMLLALSLVEGYGVLLVALFAGGLSSGAANLSANALGGDHERHHGTRSMTALHAGYSGGAVVGATSTAVALAVGVGFRTVYVVAGVIMLGLAVAAARLPIPPHGAAVPATNGGATQAGSLGLLRQPGVRLAVGLVVVAHFGDGALESFSSIYLRDLLGSGPLLVGLGIAAVHLAMLVGRLIGSAGLRRFGERRVVVVAGVGAAVGVAVALGTRATGVAIAGLLLVGFCLSPVVPIAFSLAGRAAPGRGGAAVSLVTVAGHGSLVVAPSLIGLLASWSSLRLALTLVVGTSLGIAAIGRRLPADGETELARPD